MVWSPKQVGSEPDRVREPPGPLTFWFKIFILSLDREPLLTTRLDGPVRRFSDQQTGSQKRRDLQRKDRVLRVRLGEDEYQLLKAFAESHGTTMSAMFRSFIRASVSLTNGARGSSSRQPLSQSRDSGASRMNTPLPVGGTSGHSNVAPSGGTYDYT